MDNAELVKLVEERQNCFLLRHDDGPHRTWLVPSGYVYRWIKISEDEAYNLDSNWVSNDQATELLEKASSVETFRPNI